MSTAKEQLLLEYITKARRPVTAKELAAYLGVSPRTVKNYVHSINTTHSPCLVQSSYRGYEITPKVGRAAIIQATTDTPSIPQNYTERAQFINRRFLLTHTNVLDLYDLSAQLFVSVQTIKNDLERMNLSYANFHVQYRVHGDTVTLKASEKELRRLGKYTLFEDNDKSFFDLSEFEVLFPTISITTLHQLVQQTVENYDFYVNDFARLNLVLHLAIAIIRIQNKNYLQDLLPPIKTPLGKVHRAALELADAISATFKVELTTDERSNIYLLLKANVNFANPFSGEADDSEIDPSILDFTRQIIDELSQQYYIDLSNPTFVKLLAIHFQGLHTRLLHHQQTINSVSPIVRVSYPIIFDMAVFTVIAFEKRFELKVNRDEAAYIALHIGGEMARQRVDAEKVRTVLICPEYLHLGTRLIRQLQQRFGEDLTLIATLPDTTGLSQYKYDLLLTTVPLPHQLTTQTLTVEIPLLGLAGTQTDISDAIEIIKNREARAIFRDKFDHLFSPELFWPPTGIITNKHVAMTQMAQAMVKVGNVQPSFLQSILDRDAASSTGFPNIAIPHSLNMDAVKTSVAVMLCPSGLRWDEQVVKIVLVIAIQRADGDMFRKLYQYLIQILSDGNNAQRLSRC
ncbi:BglG family transcription antiterminator [Lacticaseibacillus daqingensis]|uniref:BglG family transcription antiterminator n=1 Tax=Lacticaseibacillus daqingensis TaxID=2486014 RepID=UPI000F76D2EE|nr:PRD domain-containing protein [Lacticaseibacillus daqingensis]